VSTRLPIYFLGSLFVFGGGDGATVRLQADAATVRLKPDTTTIRLTSATTTIRLTPDTTTIRLKPGTTSAAPAERVTGIVVDQSGRGVPRAFVRVIDGTADARGIFADETGRFEVSATDAPGCRVEATLTGFQPASAPCSAGAAGALRIVLNVAPIHETMIVSATRTEAPTSQVGASATVFTEADLERRQTPLVADLLMATPGAMLVRSGAPGALTSLFVRGGESDYNKILLDGVPLNEPGGTFYLSNLTTENLERVEVLRGAYSSLFGSDAMGSVVQLFTKRGDRRSRRPAVAAQIDGGTYDTLHMSTAVSGATGALDYSLSAARFASDNRVPNSRFENNTFSANVGIAIGTSATLRAVGRAERGDAGTPGTTAFGRPDLDAFSIRHDGIASVSFDHQATGAIRQRASYSRTASSQQSTNLMLDPPYRATFQGRVATRLSNDFLNDSLSRLQRHHASYQADIRLASAPSTGDHLLTVLADWDGERSNAQNRLAATETINTRNNFGVSAQHQMLWPRVFVTAGGRVEHNDNFGTAVVPRATVVYVAHPASTTLGETLLRASTGSGIKEPTMLESFSISPFFRGNPDLKPERSRSAEVGIEQRFARDRAKVELTYFDNRFSDVIALVTTNPSTFEAQYLNVGITRARGLEAGVQARPVAAVHLRAGYTLLDSKIVASERPDDRLFGLGHQAFRRPRHSGYAGVSLNVQRVTADLTGVFIGRFVDSDFGLFSPSFDENAGHKTWDARVTAKATRRLTAILSIDNLTDVDYSEPLGYQPLGRVVRAGIRVGY
jgi:vitamin B12 transporter